MRINEAELFKIKYGTLGDELRDLVELDTAWQKINTDKTIYESHTIINAVNNDEYYSDTSYKAKAKIQITLLIVRLISALCGFAIAFFTTLMLSNVITKIPSIFILILTWLLFGFGFCFLIKKTAFDKIIDNEKKEIDYMKAELDGIEIAAIDVCERMYHKMDEMIPLAYAHPNALMRINKYMDLGRTNNIEEAIRLYSKERPNNEKKEDLYCRLEERLMQ